jgi:hypothetical protein
MKNLNKIVCFCFYLFLSGYTPAQTDSATVASISLTDGTELKGFIVEQNDSLINFKTISGIEMKIYRKLIDDISFSKGEIVQGQFQRYDPNRTRLFFGPTARTLPQGSGYFSAYMIFVPFLAIGVTDFLTLSGGMTLVPGVEEQMFYIGPKVRFLELESFSLGGGVIYSHIEESDFGIMYGVTTVGSERAALTFGIGWGYTDEELSDTPFIILGGEVQVSNSVKLLSENWIISETGVISFGIRFFGDNLAADFGLFRPVGEDTDIEGWPFFPWIGFVYNW